MKRNKYLILSCITILSFIITLQAIPIVSCLTTTINDGQNDVIKMTGFYPSGKGDFINEIDIVKLDIDGQKFNLTLGGDLESISFNFSWIEVEVMIFETYNTSKSAWDQKQYGMIYDNFFTDYLVLFYWFEPTPSGYSYWGWDNDSETFDSNTALADEVGSISANVITFEVPEKALVILDNFTFIVETQYGSLFTNQSWYYDCMPDQYAEYNYLGGGIPGYGIFIMLGAIFGITAIIIKKRLK
ncbi:MAG: hypothetical protein ACFFD2_21130 [Promethearchaeota archaeon]